MSFTCFITDNGISLFSDFGFIEFEDKRDAEDAMNQVNGKVKQ